MTGNQRIQTRGKCTEIIPGQVFSLGTTINVGQMLGGTKNGLETEGFFKFDILSQGGGYDVDISSGSPVRPAAPESPVPSFLTVLPAFPAFPVFFPTPFPFPGRKNSEKEK